MNIEAHVALARHTTIGTGGPARWFACPQTIAELQEALAFAEREAVAATVVGLGSNLLAADEGVDGLVLRLGGELAAVTVADDRVTAGGGATNAVVLHRARDAGLGGFEFACAIPGTTGGGVWMNAGAYGGDFSQVLERALVVTAAGSEWLSPDALGLTYRHSDLRDGQVVAQVELRLTPRPVDEIKTAIAQFQSQRKAAQPTNKRTFGSVFENPRHELTAGRMLEACGLQGSSHRRCPDLADARELHRERGRSAQRGRGRPHDRGAPPGARRVRRRAATRSSLSRPAGTPAADVGAPPAVAKFAA